MLGRLTRPGTQAVCQVIAVLVAAALVVAGAAYLADAWVTML